MPWKPCPRGGTLRIILTRKDNQDVIIRISDTGVGIPPELESKIFDPFFTTKEKGTGLGLSIVHSVVKNHGGTISVTEQRRGGNHFHPGPAFPQGDHGMLRGRGPGSARGRNKDENIHHRERTRTRR